MTNRMNNDIHSQLANLLENAQSLLTESSWSPLNQNVCDFGRMAEAQRQPAVYSLVAMQAEIRTLEFWRSIFSECVATFFYVVIVCSVTTSSNDDRSLQINSALASGLAAATLTLAFARVSGAHFNPAVTLGMTVVRQISPLRSMLYMCAQCGGGIAGAALVYGVYKRLNDPALKPETGAFGMEFVLTSLVVYAFCSTRADARLSHSYHQGHNGCRKSQRPHGSSPAVVSVSDARPDPLMVGVAYAACLLAWRGCINPARALGSAFVSKDQGSFDQHWVLWVGPLLGAIAGAFAFEYIFCPRQRNFSSNEIGFSNPGATNSISNTAAGFVGRSSRPHSTLPHPYAGRGTLANEVNATMQNHQDDLDLMDDLERTKQYKANITQDFTDRQCQSTSAAMYSSSVARRPYGYSGATTGIHHDRTSAAVYGGSKSLYNQPVGDGHSDVKSSSIYDGTKSCYDGYDGAGKRSIHAKLPPRRNPYDFLPDEPQTMLKTSDSTTVDGNKPDILDRSGNSRGMGVKSSLGSPGNRYRVTGTNSQHSPKHYRNDLDGNRYGNDPYRNAYRNDSLRVEDGHLTTSAKASANTTGEDLGYEAYGKKPSKRTSSEIDEEYAIGAASQKSIGQGRIRQTGHSYYPQQGIGSNSYNATYSLQNGCNITSNIGM